MLERPIANLERIALGQARRGAARSAADGGDRDEHPPFWMAIRIYTRQAAHGDGGALYSTLTRRLRRAGAAASADLRGKLGFSSDERPLRDRIATLAGRAPTYTVYVDRPRKVAELWPIVDACTARHGVVTAALVPAYRERAGAVSSGALTLGDPEDLVRQYTARATPT